MHSDRPFLEAIREQPDDDLHRLAWADWLEERGDDDRAEFLRAQLDAAHLDETDLALDALEDRADDLLARHDREWAGRVAELALEWGWSRGCVESATFAVDVLIEHGDELFEAMPVRNVRVVRGDPSRLAGCAWLRHVEHLEISTGARVRTFANAPYLRDRELGELLTSPHLGRLRSLDLRGQGVEGPLIQTLIETGLMSRLHRLDLSGNVHLGDRAARLLAGAKGPALRWLGLDKTNMTALGLLAMLSSTTLPELRTLDANLGLLFGRDRPSSGRLDRDLLQAPLAGQLASLNLEGIAFSVPMLESLVLSPIAARLTELSLKAATLKGDAEVGVLASAESLAGLRRLDLASNNLFDRGARVLASSPYLTSLVHLGLWSNDIGGPGIRALLDSPILDRVRSLDLSGNHVGVPNVTALAKPRRPRLLRDLYLRSVNLDAECAALLASGPAFARLRNLDLGSNNLGDEGVEAIVKSRQLGRLRTLDLDRTGVDTTAVEALLATPRLPSLRLLSLRNNSRISASEHDRLAARFGAATRF
jgi:uncharacterized protein (TIGR02996 family)